MTTSIYIYLIKIVYPSILVTTKSKETLVVTCPDTKRSNGVDAAVVAAVAVALPLSIREKVSFPGCSSNIKTTDNKR